MVKSYGWVVGGGCWWWPRALYCHLLGLRVLSISVPIPIPNPQSKSQSQSQSPVLIMWDYPMISLLEEWVVAHLAHVILMPLILPFFTIRGSSEIPLLSLG